MALVAKKKTKKEDVPAFLPNLLKMAEILAGKKAVNIKAYDVRGLTVLCDCFLICTVNSEPQLKAVFNTIKEDMKEIGIAPLHVEGALQGGWLLMDYNDIILHVFREKAREFYDLDGMWADSPEVKLNLE